MTDLFYCRKELNGTDMESTKDTPQTRGGLLEDGGDAGNGKDGSGRERTYDRFYGKVSRGAPCHIVVRGAGTEMDFTGKAVGDEAGYRPMSFADMAGDIHTQPFHVLPTNEGQHVAIDICRQGEILFTATQDSNSEPLRTPSGEQTDIRLDFRYATVLVSVSVLPWGGEKISQDTEM